jgi:hypothetical protein
MESNIKVQFLKINHFSVNEELLKKEPKLLEVTEKTVKELCVQIEKFFKDYKIKVKTSFDLK